MPNRITNHQSLPAEQQDSVYRCAGCGERPVSWLEKVQDPYSKEYFAILRCPTCKLAVTAPQPEDVANYYDQTYHGGRHGLTDTWCVRRRTKWVCSTIGQTGKIKRLLDVGCGEGSFLLAMKKKGWKVTGTELNPAHARQAGLQVFEGIDAVGKQLFDCITLWHSLEHFCNPKLELEKLAKRLKPNGTIIIAVPDSGGWQSSLFGQNWFHLDVPRHLFHFNKRSLQAILANQGLDMTTIAHQEFEYDLLGWVQSTLNLILKEPNLFFAVLTGRPQRCNDLMKGLNFIIGSLLMVVFTPAVLIGGRTKRGGTLIIAARLQKP